VIEDEAELPGPVVIGHGAQVPGHRHADNIDYSARWPDMRGDVRKQGLDLVTVSDIGGSGDAADLFSDSVRA
jgi:hypothetical protein